MQISYIRMLTDLVLGWYAVSTVLRTDEIVACQYWCLQHKGEY